MSNRNTPLTCTCQACFKKYRLAHSVKCALLYNCTIMYIDLCMKILWLASRTYVRRVCVCVCVCVYMTCIFEDAAQRRRCTRSGIGCWWRLERTLPPDRQVLSDLGPSCCYTLDKTVKYCDATISSRTVGCTILEIARFLVIIFTIWFIVNKGILARGILCAFKWNRGPAKIHWKNWLVKLKPSIQTKNVGYNSTNQHNI